MYDIHYLKDVPEGDIFFTDERVWVTREVFDRLADYTRSVPTGPSVGRIWKRNWGWSENMPDNWFIYVAETDPTPGYVLLRGRKAVFES